MAKKIVKASQELDETMKLLVAAQDAEDELVRTNELPGVNVKALTGGDKKKARSIPKGVGDWWELWAGALLTVEKVQDARFGVISTGSIALDAALGIGGIARGSILSIFGKEASGKTMLMQTIMGEAQKQYPAMPIMLILGEGKVSFKMMARNGVDLGKLSRGAEDMKRGRNFVMLPQSMVSGLGYEGLSVAVEQFILSDRKPKLICLDSMDSMIALKEMGANAGGGNVGGVAKFNSEWLKRMSGLCWETGSTFVFTQQLRDNVQTGGMPSYGPKTKTSGGWAPKFYSGFRIELSPAEKDTDKKTGEVYGQEIKVAIRKNEYFRHHVATSYMLRLSYDELDPGGIDRATEALELGKEFGLIGYKQPTYTFRNVPPELGGDENGNVRAASMSLARRWLLEHSEYLHGLILNIRANLTGETADNFVAERVIDSNDQDEGGDTDVDESGEDTSGTWVGADNGTNLTDESLFETRRDDEE